MRSVRTHPIVAGSVLIHGKWGNRESAGRARLTAHGVASPCHLILTAMAPFAHPRPLYPASAGLPRLRPRTPREASPRKQEGPRYDRSPSAVRR
jgi:hypothetical protein